MLFFLFWRHRTIGIFFCFCSLLIVVTHSIVFKTKRCRSIVLLCVTNRRRKAPFTWVWSMYKKNYCTLLIFANKSISHWTIFTTRNRQFFFVDDKNRPINRPFVVSEPCQFCTRFGCYDFYNTCTILIYCQIFFATRDYVGCPTSRVPIPGYITLGILPIDNANEKCKQKSIISLYAALIHLSFEVVIHTHNIHILLLLLLRFKRLHLYA